MAHMIQAMGYIGGTSFGDALHGAFAHGQLLPTIEKWVKADPEDSDPSRSRPKKISHGSIFPKHRLQALATKP